MSEDKSIEQAFFAGEAFLKKAKKKYTLNEQVPHLGEKINDFFLRSKEIISKEITVSIEECISISWTYLDAVKIVQSTFFAEEVKRNALPEEEWTRCLANPKTTLDGHDAAEEIIRGFLEFKINCDFVNRAKIARKGSFLSDCQLFAKTLGLYFLSEAENCIKCGDICHALNMIGGAFEIFIEINYAQAWDIAEGESQKERSAQAREAANARHAENRAIKESLLKWYEENKDKFTSKDKAAEEAIKQAPIAFRTARKWITEFCKHPSAGRG